MTDDIKKYQIGPDESGHPSLVIVFHGTVGGNIPSILAFGLNPGSYVTTNEEWAEYYARQKASYIQDEPVVIKIAVPRDQLSDSGMAFEYVLNIGDAVDFNRRMENRGKRRDKTLTLSCKKTTL